MEERQPSTGKRIGNVGVLDLRTASKDSLQGIRAIGNVGTVVCSAETASLLAASGIDIGNLGSTVEVPAEAKVLTGQVIIDRDYLRDQPEPLHLLVTGQLVVEPDVPEQHIAEGLGSLTVVGQMVVPENLSGPIQAKLRSLQGQMQTYRGGVRLSIGDLVLDAQTLKGLGDGTQMAVIGQVKLPEVVDDELLARKVGKLQVLGEILCHEENAATLFARLEEKTGMARKTVIPAGFCLVESALSIDALSLNGLPGRNLYCKRRVQIAGDVTPEALDEAIDRLVVRDLLLFPAALREVVGTKCALASTQALAYDGELWFVEGVFELVPSRFEYLQGTATLVVTGVVTIDPDVEPQVLAARLSKVHNRGVIRCTRAQMGAVQARLGSSEGVLKDSAVVEETEDQDRIGNVGYLKL